MVKEITDELFEQVVNGKFIPCTYIHEGSCLHCALEKFIVVFKIASKFYLPIHLIPLVIFKLKKLKTEPLNVIKSFLKNMLKSIMFMSSYIAVFRYGLCFFKNSRHVVDRWTPIMAGALGT